MSLILDALNRARQDENPVPGLGTHHPVDRNPAEWRQYLVWAALAVAVVLVVIAWIVMERFGAPPVPTSDIGAPVAELSSNIGSAVTSVTAELKARAAASVPQAVAVQPAATATRSPAQITEPLSAAANLPVQIPAPAAVTTAEPNLPQDSTSMAEETVKAPALSAAENAAVAELYQNRNLPEETVMAELASRADSRPMRGRERGAADENLGDARTERSVDIDRILQQAREEVKNATIDDHGVPFLADLSQQTKDDIPTLYYQRHDYSSDTNVSSVVFNGNPFKVGESPEPGMRVEEILPDSVVLSYHGTQFRLRALNSWINL